MLYIIVGPTASGKSNFAHRLSDYLSACPLINADAFQIYKDMDIGTNKLEKDSKYYSRYELIDFLSPEENFNIKEYQNKFRELVDISKNYVVVGGSGLYIRSAIYDYFFSEEDNSGDFDDLSNEELFKRLQSIDPMSANAIHVNNRRRLIRALQIAQSGKTKSEVISLQKHEMIYPKEEIKIIFLNPDREELCKAINKRVDQMIENGLVDECLKLNKRYHLSQTARQAIGYKEIFDYLDGKLTLPEAIELIKKRSRNYAKRQITFFRHQFDCLTFSNSEDAWNYLTKQDDKKEI